MGTGGLKNPATRGYDSRTRIIKRITRVELLPVMDVLNYGVGLEQIATLFKGWSHVLAIHFA